MQYDLIEHASAIRVIIWLVIEIIEISAYKQLNVSAQVGL